MIVKGLPRRNFYNQAWYRDIRDYVISKGYEIRKNGGKGGVNER